MRGQAGAKRALEIAAAGGHSLLLIGPPGAGKSMLAQRLPGLLPPLDDDEALECAMLHSLVRPLPPVAEWRRRPFRAPHHGASAAAVIGGGGRLRPGEISLAHHGVLFLDELPEYRRDVLEALREPLETGLGQHRARGVAGRVSGAVPAGRRDESLPLRLRRRPERPLPLHAADRRGATSRACPGRCSIASTCTSTCRGSNMRRSSPARRLPETSAAVAARVLRARERQADARLPQRRPRCRARSRRPAGSACASTACWIPRRAGSAFPRAPATASCASRARSPTSRASERVGVAELSEAIGYRRLDREPQARRASAPCGRHVLDGGAHGVVGQVHAAALRRHHARRALEALDRVLLERRHALRDARRPGGLVANPRRAGDAGAMAGDAGDSKTDLPSVGCRGARGRRAGGDRAAVAWIASAQLSCAGDGHLAERLDALVRGRLHQRVAGVTGALRAAVHEAGNAYQDQRDRDQDAEHRAENVDEMSIVLCHARIIASGPPDH